VLTGADKGDVLRLFFVQKVEEIRVNATLGKAREFLHKPNWPILQLIKALPSEYFLRRFD
jgi:hypothetical protein